MGLVSKRTRKARRVVGQLCHQCNLPIQPGDEYLESTHACSAGTDGWTRLCNHTICNETWQEIYQDSRRTPGLLTFTLWQFPHKAPRPWQEWYAERRASLGLKPADLEPRAEILTPGEHDLLVARGWVRFDVDRYNQPTGRSGRSLHIISCPDNPKWTIEDQFKAPKHSRPGESLVEFLDRADDPEQDPE